MRENHGWKTDAHHDHTRRGAHRRRGDRDAYRDLGRQAGQVVFAAVNVNQYHHAVADVAAYSRAHQLTSIPSWHFLTGPVPWLRAVWNDYNITVQAPGRCGVEPRPFGPYLVRDRNRA